MKKRLCLGVVAIFVLLLAGSRSALAANEKKVNSAVVSERLLIMPTTSSPKAIPPRPIFSWSEYVQKLKGLRNEYQTQIKTARVIEKQNLEKLRLDYLAKVKSMKKELSDKEVGLKKELKEKETLLKEEWKKNQKKA
jgi:hypothetical protein